jgi:hypothetical protein
LTARSAPVAAPEFTDQFDAALLQSLLQSPVAAQIEDAPHGSDTGNEDDNIVEFAKASMTPRRERLALLYTTCTQFSLAAPQRKRRAGARLSNFVLTPPEGG